MGEICKNVSCKKRLAEYRDLTRKQYEDIDTLEEDLEDKDVFVQTTVKDKNNYQNEIASLKKNNCKLLKENDALMEKNDQLDEDAEDGIKMVRNAHARERKLEEELKSWKESAIEDAEKVSALEKERAQFQSQYEVLKDKFSKSLVENQEILLIKESKIKEMEKEIFQSKEIKERNEKYVCSN